MTKKTITVVGGGLAGLTLGIGLRQREVPVTIWEAGRYPRHRVCGEFISGLGQGVLQRLGLWEPMLKAGAIPARTACFFIGRKRSPVRQVEPAALCLSRFKMDELLAERFVGTGGDLRTGQRWSGDTRAEATVVASGRRRQIKAGGPNWFGVKAHAREVRLEADLEIHGAREGYVGLSRLPGGEFNVCGLLRKKGAEEPKSIPELLRGQPDSHLCARLARAVFDAPSFCAVAGLSLRAQAAQAEECRISDALTMTPPVTGNGMSMAFEAAELALEPLAAYSRGEKGWEATRESLAKQYNRAFGRRLAWARWLQWTMFACVGHRWLSAWALGSDWLWQTMFASTR